MHIIHNKNQNPLLIYLVLIYLVIACQEDKYPQIFSLKDEYTFHFLNFLIIGLFNSSANSWFDIILLLTPLLENILWKT